MTARKTLIPVTYSKLSKGNAEKSQTPGFTLGVIDNKPKNIGGKTINPPTLVAAQTDRFGVLMKSIN
jgi:hypothetical protein